MHPFSYSLKITKMKNQRTPAFGSEKFGTQVMKTEECEIYIQSSLANYDEIDEFAIREALSDMRMIDLMFSAQRNHLLIGKTNQTTGSGYLRRNSSLSHTYDAIINGRLTGAI